MINDLSTDARNVILDLLDVATLEKPLTRQQIAQAANVERGTVGELLTELRLRGYLILEDGRGCWLASSFQELKEWRTKTLIPAMLHLLQTDRAMTLTAAMQFGVGREETA
jgi:hypothetical protein